MNTFAQALADYGNAQLKYQEVSKKENAVRQEKLSARNDLQLKRQLLWDAEKDSLENDVNINI